ncbi:hypothetical protein HZC00_03975 [Candidatus Kaiserbacteria bacterium]|nr:hypothetical protein [Candidatus Kaiserbacteria bacterium]
MNELFSKVSSYNILNYLLPGVLFAYLVTNLTSYSLIQKDWILGAFLYYFLGMFVSHVGSVVIAPILRVSKFAPQEEYRDYLAAVLKDAKIPLVSR